MTINQKSAISDKRYFSLPGPAAAKKPAAAKPSWKRPETEWASRLRSTARWQKLRLAVLGRHPVCIMGCGNLADQVHHINAHDPESFFDASNLVPVCAQCHEKINSAYRRGISPEMLFPKDKRLRQEDVA